MSDLDLLRTMEGYLLGTVTAGERDARETGAVQGSDLRGGVLGVLHLVVDGDEAEAFSPMSVTLTLEDEIDLSRGDMLVSPNDPLYFVGEALLAFGFRAAQVKVQQN